MKLQWSETVLGSNGKYRQAKREVDLVFIERTHAFTQPYKEGDTPNYIPEPMNGDSWQRPIYTVAILRVKGRPGVFSGVARYSASKGEVFDYSRGRKLALRRALQLVFFNQVSRAKAWYSYRLQAEMETVKAQEVRAQQQKHRAEKATLGALLDNFKSTKHQMMTEMNFSKAVGYDIEALKAEGVKEYLCGCSATGPLCPLHDQPPVGEGE